ncbi:MAG: hypothetical protein FJX21_05200, partial [Alphaproteobacteria bacterium]|nr:hypothetical protein [Alphaproteobacteria bacterium]
MLAEASRRHARWTAGHYATVSRGVRDAFWSARAGAGAADDVPGAAARALDPAEFGRARLVASPQPARRRAALPGRRLRRRAQGCRASRPRRAGRLPGRPGGRAAAGRHGPRPHGPRARAGMAGKDAAARGTGDSGLDGRARPAAARGRGRGRARMSRDVSIWLRDNALGQFATAFVENDVDWTALQILTDADLKELGLSFGPRKRLLALLAEEKRRRRLYASDEAGGERRQVTVLFCDMVGFTEMTQRIEAETMQGVIYRYQDICTTCVQRYDDHVYQHLGDGIVAFFGFPAAREDAAERAIRSALDILAALAATDMPAAGRLRARVGIATGVLVITPDEKSIVGRAMNLAARLQTLAEPGTIAVSATVRRIAGKGFRFDDIGEHALKGFARGDTPGQRLDKLEAQVVHLYGLPLLSARLIAAMLSLPQEERHGALEMSPRVAKQETMRSAIDFLAAAMRVQPSLLVFEDLHWADPSTLEVIAALIGRLRELPVLAAFTCRPGFRSDWTDESGVTALGLARLTPDASGSIVASLAGGKPLPPGLAERIVARADGVPLFVEEMLKALVEAGDLREEDGRWVATARAADAALLPDTLRDTLMARLDRSEVVKRIAQVGSV